MELRGRKRGSWPLMALLGRQGNLVSQPNSFFKTWIWFFSALKLTFFFDTILFSFRFYLKIIFKWLFYLFNKMIIKKIFMAQVDHHRSLTIFGEKVYKTLFFPMRVFFYRHWRFTGQQGKGGYHLLFHSTTSTCSRTFRHLFATLHVRWLSRIFNRNACVYQTATRWDLPPYWITIWLIDW